MDRNPDVKERLKMQNEAKFDLMDVSESVPFPEQVSPKKISEYGNWFGAPSPNAEMANFTAFRKRSKPKCDSPDNLFDKYTGRPSTQARYPKEKSLTPFEPISTTPPKIPIGVQNLTEICQRQSELHKTNVFRQTGTTSSGFPRKTMSLSANRFVDLYPPSKHTLTNPQNYNNILQKRNYYYEPYASSLSSVHLKPNESYYKNGVKLRKRIETAQSNRTNFQKPNFSISNSQGFCQSGEPSKDKRFIKSGHLGKSQTVLGKSQINFS